MFSDLFTISGFIFPNYKQTPAVPSPKNQTKWTLDGVMANAKCLVFFSDKIVQYPKTDGGRI